MFLLAVSGWRLQLALDGGSTPAPPKDCFSGGEFLSEHNCRLAARVQRRRKWAGWCWLLACVLLQSANLQECARHLVRPDRIDKLYTGSAG